MSNFKVIKRNGLFEDFNSEKIEKAILKAMKSSGIKSSKVATNISKEIEEELDSRGLDRYVIEEIENLVYDKLIKKGHKLTAKAYEGYRSIREFQRNTNTIDSQLDELIKGESEYWKSENSNKDSDLVTVQRDYMAGIVSIDIARRKIFPPDIIQAHDEGLIHIHDLDYVAQPLSNCSLINLEDMLQNGTCINKTKIFKPHRLITATTIATQVITAVSSSQFGGCTITLTHLAPFVRDSYNGFLKKYRDAGVDEETSKKLADVDLKKEIKDSVQTFNYQINSMTNTNGQSPFLTVFMYLNETVEYKEELAMLIEEFLRQRIQGMPNEDGVFITPAFPKLIYALEEDNIYENSKYWYLTKLAAECSAKRLVPDYISEKKMKELKEGNCFPSMGCVSGDEVITIKYKDNIYVESFERAWNRFSNIFEIKEQEAKGNYYIDLVGVTIFDSTKNDFVECKRIIKNKDKNDWVRLKISNGRLLTCTKDHPLAVVNKGRTFVEDIEIGDEIEGTWNTYQGNNKLDPEYAWSLGVIICDGNITNTQITCSFAATKEDDIVERLCNFYKSKNIIPRVKELSRGVKGNYKDVMFDVDLNSLDNRKSFIQYLTTGFEGKVKLDRKIPNEIFESDRESRLHFLGGIIDADGYIHDNGKTHFTQIEIGTTNKELALEQLLLINSLGYFGKIIENRYNKDKSEEIRYQVSFSCGEKNEILNYITCEKKKKCFRNHKSNKKYRGFKVSEIKELTTDGNKWSYDVTTESDRFDVSGIASHNCRSFLSPWKDENGNYKFYGRLTSFRCH